MPYQPFRLDRLSELAHLAREAGLPGSRADLPAIFICSGRSYAYVEAMSQVLGLKTHTLFEAGAGMVDPVSAHSSWHPNFTKEVQERISDIRRFMEEVVALKPGLFIDYGKRSQAAPGGRIA
jgi:trehalose-6-phosphatase